MKKDGERKDCGCCRGLSVQTPVKVFNRPGQKTLSRRVGTHGQFKQSMLSRLSAMPEMRGLTTREDDDFAMALLDSWATVADLLTFYQERISNESYLRTARERLSLQQLSRLIDYELRPGVAASAWLAFEMETAKGAPRVAAISEGTRAQSVPGQEEQAQIFETVEEILARPEWNSIRPRMTQPQPLALGMKSLVFKGVATALKTGDFLLVAPGGMGLNSEREIVRVESVNLNPQDGLTEVSLVRGEVGDAGVVSNPPLPDTSLLPAADASAFDSSHPALGEDLLEELLAGKRWRQEDLISLATIQGWEVEDLAAVVARINEKRNDAVAGDVFAMRKKAAIFGHNAPPCPQLQQGAVTAGSKFKKMIDETSSGELEEKGAPISPPGEELSAAAKELEGNAPEKTLGSEIYLDNVYPTIIEGSWVALTSREPPLIFEVAETEEITRTEGALSIKVTGLVLLRARDLQQTDDFRQQVEVLAQNEPLELAAVSIPDSVPEGVGRNSMILDGFYPGLKAKRTVILSGQPEDLPGVTVSERLIIDDVLIEDGYTRIVFRDSLRHDYLRSSVRVLANVALATQGESMQEWLGSGDGSLAFQSFKLRQSPLTYVSSPSSGGTETTLAVRVNGLLWREVSHLNDHGPRERIYTTRSDESGRTVVQFGDGRTGARLPSGRDNVQAAYRKGIGLAGMVKSGQITSLMTRPLGVRGVVNPLPSAGGEDAEALDDARCNAPLNVMTLGRVVSLSDFENFARAFAGVAKSLATWTWDGERRSIVLTVAGPNGSAIEMGSDIGDKLLQALRNSGDPRVPLQVKSYRKACFRLSAEVKVDPAYQIEMVLAGVESALRNKFSFESREFGQPVTYDEVMAVMQEAPGVIAVNIKALYKWPLSQEQSQSKNLPCDRFLPANAPAAGGMEALAAELLTLDPAPLHLEVMA